MNTNYPQEMFGGDFDASMKCRKVPPWFRLKEIIEEVPKERQEYFVSCLYILILLDQAQATYRLALQKPWGRRDPDWNTDFPKYGPGGIGKAHVPPHELISESCKLGIYKIENLHAILKEQISECLRDESFILRYFNIDNHYTKFLFLQILKDPDVMVSAKRVQSHPIKHAVFTALVHAHKMLY